MLFAGIFLAFFFLFFVAWDIFANRRVTIINSILIMGAAASYFLIFYPMYEKQGYPGNQIKTPEFTVIQYVATADTLYLWLVEDGQRDPRNFSTPMTEGLKKELSNLENKRGEKRRGQPFRGKKGKGKGGNGFGFFSGKPGDKEGGNSKAFSAQNSGVDVQETDSPLRFSPDMSEVLPPKQD